MTLTIYYIFPRHQCMLVFVTSLTNIPLIVLSVMCQGASAIRGPWDFLRETSTAFYRSTSMGGRDVELLIVFYI